MQNPRFPLPSRYIIRNRLDAKLAEVEIDMLVGLVPASKVAISMDIWSSGMTEEEILTEQVQPERAKVVDSSDK
jgi:hypothetical protein